MRGAGGSVVSTDDAPLLADGLHVAPMMHLKFVTGVLYQVSY
jgi:hypothetical protein